MTDKKFMTAKEVAEEMRISVSTAYKVVRKLNEELEALGYTTISGKVNRRYFLEKICYGEGATG
jgi:transposase